MDPLGEHRPMLFGLAYRLLGSVADAEDVLQDAYLKWRSVSHEEIRQPRRYLSRIVTRAAIDRLRARGSHETYVGQWLPEPVLTSTPAQLLDPAETAERRDSVAIATLHIMERLDPVERAVYVLRQAFELPYVQIAETVQRSEGHCRQLFRRASARLDEDQRHFSPSRAEHAALLASFLAAACQGDVPALRALLHEEVVAWTDSGGATKAARNPIVGADKTSRFFAGVYGLRDGMTTTFVELNGAPGAIMRLADFTQAISFAVHDGRISGAFVVSNPDKLTTIAGV
ncbi:RNA polymerase sigma factor SigJ [Natronoglycomyces albus]|uniref:RNA polymerase sigma factor SigJ n=1 Tax=Natronoglycomyces albus TaxID=2811108 RepID=A0A895XEX6_9ACTN|nr:RNA polymerase sigma factor SigJ [Natronoglycomyces albus]QSB04391.1 RNA polymerase sigma factor SigJ [Natronoglycomyces albus]